MPLIRWTDESVGNLEAIVTYISAFNPAAAARLGERLVALADSLAEFPERGRAVDGGVREMTVVRPYVLRYRVGQGAVTILPVRHGAQAPSRSRGAIGRAREEVANGPGWQGRMVEALRKAAGLG